MCNKGFPSPDRTYPSEWGASCSKTTQTGIHNITRPGRKTGRWMASCLDTPSGVSDRGGLHLTWPVTQAALSPC